MGKLQVNGDINATGTISATSFLGNASSATTARFLSSHDTRDDSIEPNQMKADEAVQFDFKADSTINLTDAPYSGVMSYRPYSHSSDWTGGPAHQLAFNSAGLYWRQSSGNAWLSWNKLIHSGNYTSYTVTKTGSGASGTWGINITGNAATATTANSVAWGNVTSKPSSFTPSSHTHNYIEPKGIYTFTSSTLPNSFDFGISCGFVDHNAGFGNYGSVLTVRTYSGGGGTLQLYAPYSPTYGGTRLKARFGNYDSSGGNSWTSLKEIAWLSDLSSYLPLSGGTMSGAITMNVGTGIQMKFEGGKDTRWIYPEGADTFGIRYYEGNPDRMTISASGNNNTTAGADLCINGNGDGTVTIRGNTILHAGNYSSYALPKSGGTVNGNLNIGYSLGISQENGGGNGISLYGGPGYVQNYGLYFAKTSNFGTHGAVTGDWATYFSMDGTVDRGWIFRHGNGNKVASISASGIISGAAFSNGSSYHLHPGGGVYVCSTPSITGYLKITLPVGWTNTMFRFDINIYDYSDQNAVTYTVGGYNYQPSAAWYNYSAESRGHGDKANLPVSFGYDGSRCAVYIGWGHTAWSYPQVSISNVLTGYSNYSATWSGSWGIGFSSTNNGTAQVIYNPNISARTVNYGGSLPSHGYHPGAIFYKT